MYLEMKIRNITLEYYLRDLSIPLLYKARMIWGALHICLGFYHHSGPFIVDEDFELLEKMLDQFNPSFISHLTVDVVISFYHIVVGTYGWTPLSESYFDQVSEYLQLVQQLEDDDIPLVIIPHPERTLLPYPQDY